MSAVLVATFCHVSPLFYSNLISYIIEITNVLLNKSWPKLSTERFSNDLMSYA